MHVAMDKEKLAKRFGIPIIEDILHYPFVKDRMHILPYSFVKLRMILPLEKIEGVLHLAISDPTDLEGIREVSFMLGIPVKEFFIDSFRLQKAIEHCYRQRDSETSRYLEELSTDGRLPDQMEYDLLETNNLSPVIRLLNMIIIEAIQQRASDIHFEPREEGLIVRYRIDGVLQKRHTPSREYQKQLLTRLKVMAKLDIAEQRLPQDGRIKLRFGEQEIDFRVSTIPVINGERIVLRILDKSNVVVGLASIGMNVQVLETFRKLIKQTQGIILVTGPTGSGKTTTLYSAISEINSEDFNIITIEDPVEYKLSGIAQISINPKISFTFSKGLRHILRQDPDIIMIGEIRDRETADIAIQASLTGHLVLSTLHTNSAASALTRLVDMGIESYLLSSSVIGIIAQRLVRKICVHCKVEYFPSQEECLELGYNWSEKLVFYRGSGCQKCFHLGYHGRIGIYEFLLITSSIQQQLTKNADATSLQKLAEEQGMQTLRGSGVQLVLKGETSVAEVLRVTRTFE